MSQKKKLLEKIKSAPKNVEIEDLVKLMEYYGFTYRKSKEGYFFKHEKLVGKLLPNVPIPHGRENKVRYHYVSRCLEAIELLKYEEEKE